jgi:hypothetical protein
MNKNQTQWLNYNWPAITGVGACVPGELAFRKAVGGTAFPGPVIGRTRKPRADERGESLGDE